MKKSQLIGAMGGVLSLAFFFQNCGPQYLSLPRGEVISSSSTGEESSTSDAAGSDPLNEELPTVGSVTPRGAPEILKGLTDRLEFRKSEGHIVEVEVANHKELQFKWLVNGKAVETNEPKIKVSEVGVVDVAVVVADKDGRTSSSRATLSVAPFSVTDGKLIYFDPEDKPAVVPDADVASVKLISVQAVADRRQLYYATTELRVTKIDDGSIPRVLSPHHSIIGKQVYYKGRIIKSASADDFTVFPNTPYAKSSQTVFCGDTNLISADPKSFQIPISSVSHLARDKSNLYLGCIPQPYKESRFSLVKMISSQYLKIKALVMYNERYHYLEFRPELDSYSVIEPSPVVMEIPFIPASGAEIKFIGNDIQNLLVTDGIQYAGYPNQAFTGFVKLTSSVQTDTANLSHLENKIYVDKEQVYVYNTVAKTFDALPGAAPATFKKLEGEIYRSGIHRYSITPNGVWEALPDISDRNPLLISGRVYRGDTKIYFKTDSGDFQEVTGANADSFTELEYGLFRDGPKVWISGQKDLHILSGVDGATLNVLGGCNDGILIRDANKLFRVLATQNKVVNPSTSPPTIISTDVVKFSNLDVRNVSEIKLIKYSWYFHNNSEIYYCDYDKITLVAGVKPGVLKKFDHLVIGSDSVLVIRGVVAPKFRADKLIPLGDSGFFTDGSSVLAQYNKILADADGAKFRIVDVKKSAWYATDGTRVWFEDQLIKSADAATFKVLTNKKAEDKSNVYTRAVAKPKVIVPTVVEAKDSL